MYNNYVLHMYVHVCVGNFNCVRNNRVTDMHVLYIV